MSFIDKKGYLYGMAAVVIWSGFILVSRLGGISPLSHYDVIAIRYVSCAAILLPLWWFKFPFKLLDIRFITAGIVGGLAYALFAFKGFELAPASHAALLLPGLMPFFIIILSAFFAGEHIRPERWIGVVVISMGVGSLLWGKISNGASFSTGHWNLMAAALCWGVFSVLIKRWNITPWQATVSLALVTCALYLPVYLLFLPSNIDFSILSTLSALADDILIQVFYQGVMATIVQMLFYVKAVTLLGPSRMGTLMALVPLIAGFSGVLLFEEVLDIGLAMGLILVCAGAAFAHTQFFKIKRSVPCPT